MKTILLTEINSFLGMHTAKSLLKKGFRVRGVSSGNGVNGDLLQVLCESEEEQRRLEILPFDETAEGHMAHLMSGVSGVIHLLPNPRVYADNSTRDCTDSCLLSSRGLLEAAFAAKVDRVVLGSSIWTMTGDMDEGTLNEGRWTDPEGKGVCERSRLATAIELMAWAYWKELEETKRFDLLSFHRSFLIGPSIAPNRREENDNLIGRLLEKGMRFIPRAKWPLSDVRDVAQALTESIDSDEGNGRRFVVTTEESYSFRDIYRALERSGAEVGSAAAVPGFMLKAMNVLGMVHGTLAGMADRNILADTRPARQIFKWRTVSLEESIDDALGS